MGCPLWSLGEADLDFDRDGNLDLVIGHRHAPSVVLWNETPAQGRSLILDLRGEGKNRDAIGAKVVARVGDRLLTRSREDGGSYLSSHDRRIHLGLEQAGQADHIEVC